MIINHNIPALNTVNKLTQNNKKTTSAMEKLSSGLRINKAGDDAAGLAISEKMRGQIRGLQQAQRNIQDGISLIQTAESGLGSIQDPNLQRLRELAIQAATDTLTDADRQLIQKEVEQIKQGINDIANNTEFNGIKLLNRTPNVTNHPIDFTFKSISSGTTESFFGIAYNGSTYVAVGGNGAIFTSTDGETWGEHSLPVADLLTDVKWDGNKFIAVGTDGRIITSTDGNAWFGKNSGTINEFWGIDYNGSTYVAVGLDGLIMTSSDGSSWSSQTSGTTDNLRKVTWNGSQYVAVGDNGTILTSSNGTSWTGQSSGTTNTLTEVAWDGNKYVAVGTNGTILTSSNGTSWTSQSSGTTNHLFNVVWANNTFVASSSNGELLYSKDGNSWEVKPTDITAGRLEDILWNGDKFYIVGELGQILEVSINNPSDTSEIPKLNLQVGANSGETFTVELTDASTRALGIDDINLSTRQGAESAISKIDEALNKVSSERSKFGAYQNALEHINNNASNYELNLTASESRIRDVDIAKQIMDLTKNQILTQASQAMLTQTSQQPQSILQLLK